jgi:hypothetical protein
MVDLVSLPVISVLHLVGVPSLFDASANTVSSVCSCFDYQLPSSVHDFAIHRPHRYLSSLLTSHFDLQLQLQPHFDLPPRSHFDIQPSSYINFNLHLHLTSTFNLHPTSTFHLHPTSTFNLYLTSTFNFDLHLASRLHHTWYAGWVSHGSER